MNFRIAFYVKSIRGLSPITEHPTKRVKTV